MAAYIRENNFKFDKVDRTYKKDTVNAIANSIYHLKDVEKISEALGYYLDIYRTDGKKSYDGSDKRFLSHYIPAIEFGVIKTSSPYTLSELAIKMVKGDINPTEYMSTILLNYFQIIDGKCVNLLYRILLVVEKIGDILSIVDLIKEEYFQEREHAIIAMKILGDSYFFDLDKDKLVFNKLEFNLKSLIKITKFKEEEANKFPVEYFKSQENFSNFLTNCVNSNVVFPTLKKEILKTVNKKLPYQKIVYGAPGTGKSYGLANQVKAEFPNFINPINEFNISENNEKIWLVGATWGNFNKYPEFIEDNKWINGYDSGSDFQRAEKMSIDDYIIIKTAYFTGEGNKVPTLEIKAIGKIKSIKVSGKEVEVEWLIKDLCKKIIGENFRATVHDISQKKDLVNKIFDNTEIFTKKTEEIKASQRVTFYDGYTYGQFVGAYKPVMYEKDNEEKEIGYEFVAGPLLKQVLNAYKYPEKDFVLIIEEINRAKADRIFGDIFQLLDRNSEGESEYPILLSQEQDNYFKENLDGERYLETIGKKEGLYLPNNLYIWATMNSADQGVYPMDTAFKRRWDFDYIPLNKNQGEEEFLVEIDNKKYNWNDYRETLNDILGEQGVTEDRLISPYFLKVTDFDEYKVLKVSSYVNKFLMYIFDDILKHNNRLKEALFTEKNFYKIFSKLQNGIQIYSTNFMDRLNERIKKVDDEINEE